MWLIRTGPRGTPDALKMTTAPPQELLYVIFVLWGEARQTKQRGKRVGLAWQTVLAQCVQLFRLPVEAPWPLTPSKIIRRKWHHLFRNREPAVSLLAGQRCSWRAKYPSSRRDSWVRVNWSHLHHYSVSSHASLFLESLHVLHLSRSEGEEMFWGAEFYSSGLAFTEPDTVTL